MNFNNHSTLEGQHAFLSASKYHWVNYDDNKLKESFTKSLATQRGTELHELAAKLIKTRIKVARSPHTFNMYVNDAIGFCMKPEQVLYYSHNCFGTADAISFKKNFLRIHDLKTGVSPTKMGQLEIYTALFCLEYSVNPRDIEIELRIYQNDEVLVHHPDKEKIIFITKQIVHFDKIIQEEINSED